MKEIFNIYNSYENHSCGYHDLSPFSPNEKYMVFCSLASSNFKEKIIFSKDLVNVDINLINLNNFQIKKIFNSKCYSLEQGVRINWIDNKRISINILDDFKYPKFIILNIISGKIEKIIKNYFAHQLTGNKKEICTSLDYSTIRDYWTSYGFYHKATKFQPRNSLNVYNWVQNKLLFRIYLNQLDSYRKLKDGYIIHPTMSEDGKKLLFMHRINLKNILYSWIYLADIETDKINLITEEKVSHFTWINNDKFLLFQRIVPGIIKKRRLEFTHGNIKNLNKKSFPINNINKKNIIFSRMLKLFIQRISSGFVLYTINKNKIIKKVISLNLFGIDCHPFYAHSKNKIFLDSYPDNKSKVNIFSINLNNKLFAKKEMQISGDWETHIGKVDAHIRFSPKSNYACIDSVFKKVRIVKIFKITNSIN